MSNHRETVGCSSCGYSPPKNDSVAWLNIQTPNSGKGCAACRLLAAVLQNYGKGPTTLYQSPNKSFIIGDSNIELYVLPGK
jgi:hypothetical protein